LETKFPLQPLLRTYGNWLACIAGSMARVAFIAAWEKKRGLSRKPSDE